MEAICWVEMCAPGRGNEVTEASAFWGSGLGEMEGAGKVPGKPSALLSLPGGGRCEGRSYPQRCDLTKVAFLNLDVPSIGGTISHVVKIYNTRKPAVPFPALSS